MRKQYDTTWEGGGVIPKKYHISIEGIGTAEEVMKAIGDLQEILNRDYMMNWGWNNTQSIAGTNEYCYTDDGILRTEVNEINE